jgi:hypothetical protein
VHGNCHRSWELWQGGLCDNCGKCRKCGTHWKCSGCSSGVTCACRSLSQSRCNLRCEDWIPCVQFFPDVLKAREEAKKRGLTKAKRKHGKNKELCPPVIHNDCFNDEHKHLLSAHWEVPCNKEDVSKHLNDGGATDEKKRGASCRKHIPILCQLGKEHSSPKKFVQREGDLFKWECDIQMQEFNCGRMLDLARCPDRMRDQ